MNLQEKLRQGKFVITSEVTPPKGIDTFELLGETEALKGRVDAVNVSDGKSSVMAMTALALGHLLQEKGFEPILNVSCRDRNRLALQADLLGAAALGMQNILVLTGDYASMGDHPQTKPVFDLDSIQLLRAIQMLELGQDMGGNELRGAPRFFAGATVSPTPGTVVASELQLLKMEKKIFAGAKFFQTQAVYDPVLFAKFMKRVEQYKVPVLAGVIPLKSAGMAKFMNKSVAGVCVPQEMIDKIAKAEDKTRTGIEMCADLINQLKGMCQGVHIMAIGWEKKVPQIVGAAGI